MRSGRELGQGQRGDGHLLGNQLPGRFLTEFYLTYARWIAWATEVVEGWPDEVTQAPFDERAAVEGVRLAESIPAVLDRPARRKRG